MKVSIIILGEYRFIPDAYQIIPIQKRGRGNAVFEGLKKVTGEAVLILHEDTKLPSNWKSEVERVLKKYDGGGFRLKFDKNTPYLKLMIFLSNLLYKINNELWGDRALFFHTNKLRQIQHKINIPLMEDVIMCRYNKMGLTNSHVITSAAKFNSPLKHTFKILKIRTKFALGISAEKLYNDYYEIHIRI